MSAKRVPRKKTAKKYGDHYRRAAGQTQTTISIDRELLEQIKICAAEDDRSVSNFIVSEMRKVIRKKMSR